jgi:hypothetical protein
VAFKALADGNVEVEHPRHVIQQEKEVVDASPLQKGLYGPEWLTTLVCVGR